MSMTTSPVKSHARVKNHIKRSRGDVIFDTINILIIGLITLTMIYPMWYVLIVSFATPEEAALGRLYFWPKTFSVEAYQKVFGEGLPGTMAGVEAAVRARLGIVWMRRGKRIAA